MQELLTQGYFVREDGTRSQNKPIKTEVQTKIEGATAKNDLVKNSLMIGAKNYIVKPLDRKKVLERIVLALS